MKLSKIIHIIDYIKFVVNWYDVFMLRMGLKDEIKITLRSKNKCPLVIDRKAYPTLSGLIYLMRLGASYDSCSDILKMIYANKELIFSGIMENKHNLSILSNLYITFYKEVYGFLDVKDKTVVDVGASIGDTPIYFAVRGARKVIAYEPIPYICKLLKENVRLNNMDTIIDVECSAASLAPASASKLLLCWVEERHSESHIVDNAEDCVEGKVVEVPVSTIPSADVLKMNCEGCEFDIILNMEKPMFYEIGVEYHDKPDKLVEKLKELGYEVALVKQLPASGRYGDLGILHAKLKR